MAQSGLPGGRPACALAAAVAMATIKMAKAAVRAMLMASQGAVDTFNVQRELIMGLAVRLTGVMASET